MLSKLPDVWTCRGLALENRIAALPQSIAADDAKRWLNRAETHRAREIVGGPITRAIGRIAARFWYAMAEGTAARLERRAKQAAPAPAPIVRQEDREWREAFDEWREANAAYKAREAREREEWIREQARRDDERAATKPAELVAQAVEEHQAAELVGDPPPAGDAVAELVAEVLAGPQDAGQQETAEFPAYTDATTEAREQSP